MNKKPKIYTIATAHLDTVWNWDFEHVITVCLKDTLYRNFELFEKYPDYRFNFEGTYRYELFEEYYPEEFEKLKEYVKQGKWNVTGSAFENGDVNVPSPESLFRNILFGNNYFEEKFGKRSNDIFLPDCFGFGHALPSIINHANLCGFSTRKLTWGGAYGRPFDIGLWQGVDGNKIFASIDSRSYCMTYDRVRTKPDLVKKLKNNTEKYDFPVTFGYYGVGDKGGAPKEKGVKVLQAEINRNPTSDIRIVSASPTEFFEDMKALSPEEMAKLPTWNNELVLTNHGVGSYTSRAFSKRFNRRNEELADMAERASVVSMSLCNFDYPQANLEKAWKRTIAHTFHDDITGTSVQRVYKRSWNDLVLSANRFSSIYEGSSAETIKNLDTSWTKGTAIVVSNMMEFERASVVDFVVPANKFEHIRVFDKNGTEIPSQVNSIDDEGIHGCFVANVKAMGYKVYDVLYSYEPCTINTGLRANDYSIESSKYQVTLNRNGDIASIIDKTLDNKEILSKPIRFELNKYNGNKAYPAWELVYKEVNKYPWEFADKGQYEVIENGPCRVAIKVKQTCHNSSFCYVVSLSVGSPFVSVYNEIEWREFKRILHNGFSFNLKNSFATYDLGLGCIQRGVANKKLYNGPAQKWADISDKFSDFGVSIFSDSKYSWMMKDEKTLRLTVVHSPKHYYRSDSAQGWLDFGQNRYGYAIYSHAGKDLTLTRRYAREFNQPMTTFVTTKHNGTLGDDFSFVSISNPSVIIRAIKKAEKSDELIIRVNEGANKAATNVQISLGNGILSAREVYASEEDKGSAEVIDGKLVFSLNPYEIKSFAVKLYENKIPGTKKMSPVALDYNKNILSTPDKKSGNDIPTIGRSIPSQLYPSVIDAMSIKFKLNNDPETDNALICQGQKISVSGNKFYFIGASLYGDKTYNFALDGKEIGVKVQSIDEKVGAWDLYELCETGYIKHDKLAWECTHTNSGGKTNPADRLFFFLYEIDTEGVSEITLPKDNGLMILAATELFEARDVKLITTLYDKAEKRPFDFKLSRKDNRAYKTLKRLSKKKENFS